MVTGDAGRLTNAHTSGLLSDTGRNPWEGRTVEEWRDIGRSYGLTDVLTPADWALQVPAIARGADVILYGITSR